ncbi:MAG: RNA polymerase sigma factor [Verrucomicrobiota bacterium]
MHSELNFDEVVERFAEPLYRFAMSLTRTPMDAEDLVQQTFLTWAEKGHQLLEPSKLKSWLFTTLHRAHLGSRRRMVRFPHVEIEDVEEELPVIEIEIVRKLDGERLLELLGTVDEQYQAAVALFYLEDCTYPEIAETLEVPLGTVKSRIARGIAQLKQIVAREGTDSKRRLTVGL